MYKPIIYNHLPLFSPWPFHDVWHLQALQEPQIRRKALRKSDAAANEGQNVAAQRPGDVLQRPKYAKVICIMCIRYS